MNIYFVRHGETLSNREKKYYGNYESTLSFQGKRECEELREKFNGISFDKIYCSEKQRAKESLQIINGSLENAIISPLLNERHFGIFENKSYEEIKELHSLEQKLWEKDWKNYIIPQGESAVSFYERCKEFMESLEKEEGENILVVTHGGFIRNVYCYILGGLDVFWKFSSRNGDVTLVKYEYNNWFIDYISHIERKKNE
ncbi:MAG: histidine phosphatase family protein [Clostridium sp.]